MARTIIEIGGTTIQATQNASDTQTLFMVLAFMFVLYLGTSLLSILLETLTNIAKFLAGQ